MEEYFETNKRRWNELVDIHAASKEYDLEGFLAGKNSLHRVELEKLGDVTGKRLLHLQCHFGSLVEILGLLDKRTDLGLRWDYRHHSLSGNH